MITIRRLIPPSQQKDLALELEERNQTALVINAYQDGLVGFISGEDGETSRPVYDVSLVTEAVARQHQDDEQLSDDEALGQAEDTVAYNRGFHMGEDAPVYVELGGAYYGMTLDSYQANAIRSAQGMDDPAMLANWGLGLAGEAGEVIEVIKKHLYHGKGLDTDALTKELGDVLWYVAAICSQVGISMEDVAERNVDKLSARYPNGFVKGGGNRD